MQVILDDIEIPEAGVLEIHQHLAIGISAKQATRLANRYLLNEVSLSLIADAPILVINGQSFWRLPVWIGFRHHGRIDVGALEIEATTGEFLNLKSTTAEIRARAAAAAATLPSYTPATSILPEHLATDLPQYTTPAVAPASSLESF